MILQPGFRARFLVVAALMAAFVTAGALAANPPSLVNRKAPRLMRRDLHGQSIDLARMRGQVVLLNFWATWCAPCQIEMPVFARWQRQYGPRGLRIIGISMDDNAEPVRKLLDKLKLNYPVAMGDAALGERYGGVLGLPLTFLIDRSGTIRAQFQGESDLHQMEAKLNNLLQDH